MRARSPFRHYGRVPKGLILSELSSTAVRVFALLDDLAGAGREFTQTELAEMLHCTTRTVIRAIQELEDTGWIEVSRRRDDAGRQTTSGYVLRSEPGDNSVQNPGDNSVTTYRRNRDDTSLRDVKKRLSTTPMSQDFDRFWREYPLKKAKGDARKAWAQAIKSTEPELIIAGAVRYTNDPSRKPAYTRYPGTWLRGEGWADEASRDVEADAIRDPDSRWATAGAGGSL